MWFIFPQIAGLGLDETVQIEIGVHGIVPPVDNATPVGRFAKVWLPTESAIHAP
jgi:hypothetical protein